VSTAIRLLLLLCLVLALAGVRVRTTTRDLAVIFLVDVSASVGPNQQSDVLAFINSEIDRAAPRDYVGVIAFGREPSVELAPTRKEMLAQWRLTEISSNPSRDYTDIAAAFRLAAALAPEDAVGRFVLISDGNENMESATSQAQLLKAQGIEVYTRAVATVSELGEGRGEVALRELAAAERPAVGEAFDLRATIDATRDTEAALRIFRNESLVAERRIRLSSTGENVFVIPQRLDKKGFYTYRAEVEALGADGFVQNNSREAFSMVEGRPKTLYLHGDPRRSPAIARVLAEGNFDAEIRPDAVVPSSLAGFQDYDLVIFDNVPATRLTRDQMKMVQSYVRDLGGGFLMIGGEQSFGPGGYYKTVVEEVLPVSLDVRQKKHFPSLALALVIDKSGSMSGLKIQLAVEAATATVELLSERDSVGVIAFDDTASTVVKLTQVDSKHDIARQIRSIQALGGTNIYAGLDSAHQMLASSDAQIRHMILLSDGQSYGDFPALTRSIRESGITLSTVAVGDDADIPLMKTLADSGGGRFYATESPEDLPQIFTREAFLASRSTIIEEPFVPRLVRPTQATAGVDWNNAPQLGGYVGTAERDQLQSPAVTSLVSHKDDPVYAVWQYGLGRSAAFTSDAKPRWAAGWMGWPGFGQFWTQVLRDTLRREGSSELVGRVDMEAGKGHITVEAVTPEGSFRNNLALRANVVGPDFSTTVVALEQTAAGQYEGDFAAAARGAYLVSVAEEGGEAAMVTGAVNSYSPEFAVSTGDVNLLSRMSEMTGGRALEAQSGDLFDRRAARSRPQEIWESLVMIVLLLLPIDIGIRRLHITRREVVQARAWLVSKLRHRREGEISEAAAALAQLKDARSRVRLGEDGTGTGSALTDEAQSDTSDQRRQESAQPASVVEADQQRPLASRLLEAQRKRRQ
jgi:uncharacterized membrane protein